MARSAPRDTAGYRRLSTHGVALVAVIGAVVVGVASATPVAEMQIAGAQSALDYDQDAAPSQALPAQAALDLGRPNSTEPASPPIALAETSPPRTQGADQRQAVAFNPRLGLPQWLRTIQDVA